MKFMFFEKKNFQFSYVGVFWFSSSNLFIVVSLCCCLSLEILLLTHSSKHKRERGPINFTNWSLNRTCQFTFQFFSADSFNHLWGYYSCSSAVLDSRKNGYRLVAERELGEGHAMINQICCSSINHHPIVHVTWFPLSSLGSKTFSEESSNDKQNKKEWKYIHDRLGSTDSAEMLIVPDELTESSSDIKHV